MMLMNFIEDIDEFDFVEADELEHIGMPRRSGRYPWGSGDNPYQSSRDFLGRVEELRKQGFTFTDENGKTWTGDTAIAKSMGLSSTQFRTEIGLCKDERRMLSVARAEALQKDGLNPTEIGREMGVNESTVRSWLNEKSKARMEQAQETANFIRNQIETKGMIDIGKGVERELGISQEKLNQALYILEREGYPVYSGRFEQKTNPGQWTTQKVICPKDTLHKEIYNLDQIHALNEDQWISRDGGNTFEKKFTYPASMDSKRMMIRYKEDGGVEKDGIVELRRGVEDLSLGESRYSQVRILVDGTHFIKGMAVYSDNMPDGVDVIFNTNKTKDKSLYEVLKPIKKDIDNPFGSAIKDADQGGQYWYTDSKTGEKKLGLINKRADEGDWSEWKDALPSQFLGKQSLAMAKKQLNLAKVDKMAEYEDICALNNPTIKKHLLQKFADECDSSAVHLQAAALPGQKYHVIVPVNTLKDTEVYAPGYEPGTKLALVRYPHGGTFEIPIVTVTHQNKIAQELIGAQSSDAICINHKVAERLSGADFDGDTVMCIPTHDPAGKVKIKNRDTLPGLEGFDPKDAYPERKGMKYMKDPVTGKDSTQMQMGIISNLITDMTLGGAKDDELAAAVRHSMVVIDAGKHKLDYRQSEIDNNIAELKKKYQVKIDETTGEVKYGGASTILSRSKGEATIDKRQGSPKINIKGTADYDPSRPEGSLLYKTADDLYYPERSYNKDTKTVTIKTTSGKPVTYRVDDKEASARYNPVKREDKTTGKVTYTDSTGTITYRTKKRTQKSTQMAETDDAYSLVSAARHPMEMVYADHANYMKSLANQARKEMVSTPKLKYDAESAKVYSEEVASLKSKLNSALLNTTRERAAQRSANAEVAAKLNAGQIEKADIKKTSQRALTKYRDEYGSIARRDRSIQITDREWEAIQAGAISESKLKQILDNSDVDSLRERATPRSSTTLSTAKINRIKSLSASNYTLAEIAKKLGVSTSTVSQYLKGAK